MNVIGGWSCRRSRLAGVLGAAVLALSACGGGSQVEPFRPTRIFAFGDEVSVINDAGRKYTVNGLNAEGANDCRVNAIWIQFVASGFDLVFPQCNPDAVAAPQGRILATAGAKVADVKAQIDEFVATASPAQADLTTVMVGVHDILEQYARYPATSEADITAELEARGTLLGEQINRVALAGPAVIVSTAHDLSVMPFGLAEKAAHADTDRAALLKRLTQAFNGAMRLALINDGRLIGLVFGDEDERNVALNREVFGVDNAKDVICTVALPDCDTTTMVEGAGARNWLWADATHIGPLLHTRLGGLALNRARNNPFVSKE